MKQILEPQKQLELKAQYDVIVAGGGIAGVAAALSAARLGAKTLLIEKQYLLGGLATLGLITIYLPLCDGKGKQVSYSIAEELLRLSIKHGFEADYPYPWLDQNSNQSKADCRFQVRYNANICAILMEQLLVENGVKILYGTTVCNTFMNDDTIQVLIVENKSGRSALECGSVVDCTGDADIAHLSGEETAIFKQKNILAGWYYQYQNQKLNLNMLGYADIPDKFKQEGHKDRETKRYTGIDAEEVSQMILDSHKLLLDSFLEQGDLSPDHALTSIASIPQVRMTRRIRGAYTLDDTEMHHKFSDSVGLISNWRKAGPIYEIPYRTLYGNKIKNLITAGRCISVTDSMWDLSRVIPACAVTGEAAGAAAALTNHFSQLKIEQLQEILKQRGVVLHEDEIDY